MTSPSKTIEARLVEALQKNSKAIPEDVIEELAAIRASEDSAAWESVRKILIHFKALQPAEKAIKVYLASTGDIALYPGAVSADSYPVSEIWEGLDIDDRIYPPKDYVISAPGAESDCIEFVRRTEERTTRVKVAGRPVVVSRVFQNLDDGHERRELTFYRRGQWKKHIFRAEDLASSTRITDVASSVGVSVISPTAAELVKFLQCYEEENEDYIPMVMSTRRMGWHGTDSDPLKYGFMAGKTHIPGRNGEHIEMEKGDSLQEVSAVSSKGSHEEWVKAANRMMDFPMMRIAFAASVAPILLRLLDAPNAIVEFSGKTSTGKSTVLKIAQSCWRSSTDSLGTWDLTSNAAQALAKLNCDMPLVLDDTNSTGVDERARKNLVRMVYQLFGGRSRGRADREGDMKDRTQWRTVVISTGEQQLTKIVDAEGAAARILSMWGKPLGEFSERTAGIVSECMSVMSRNYGHAGPMVAKAIASMSPDDIEVYRNMFEESVVNVSKTLLSTGGKSSVGDRMARTICLLDAASHFLKLSGALPKAWSLIADPDTREILERAVTETQRSANKGKAAWHELRQWCQANPDKFTRWGKEPKNSGNGGGKAGWVRIEDDNGILDAPHYYFRKAALVQALKECHYENCDAIIQRIIDDGGFVNRSKSRPGFSCASPFAGAKRTWFLVLHDRYGDYVLPESTPEDDAGVRGN